MSVKEPSARMVEDTIWDWLEALLEDDKDFIENTQGRVGVIEDVTCQLVYALVNGKVSSTFLEAMVEEATRYLKQKEMEEKEKKDGKTSKS